METDEVTMSIKAMEELEKLMEERETELSCAALNMLSAFVVEMLEIERFEQSEVEKVNLKAYPSEMKESLKVESLIMIVER